MIKQDSRSRSWWRWLSAMALCMTLLGGVGVSGPLCADEPAVDEPAAKNAENTGGAEQETNEEDEAAIEVTVTENGVSVYAVKADACRLLIELAEKTGLHIIVDDTVARTLTVNLVNKQARAILDHIVDAYGLSLAEMENVLIVSEGLPTSPSSYLMGDIAAVTTHYVQPARAKELLPPFLHFHVKTNLAQNSVVLSAPAEISAWEARWG